MTRSAKGTAEEHGRMVKQKAGLNREILNTAPALTFNLLRYKAEEASSKCGCEKPRDIASAQVNLNWALGIQAGNQPKRLT